MSESLVTFLNYLEMGCLTVFYLRFPQVENVFIQFYWSLKYEHKNIRRLNRLHKGFFNKKEAFEYMRIQIYFINSFESEKKSMDSFKKV